MPGLIVPFDLEWLAAFHAQHRLQLVTADGKPQGVLHMDGDTHAIVSELIRLARLGQAAEAANLETAP